MNRREQPRGARHGHPNVPHQTLARGKREPAEEELLEHRRDRARGDDERDDDRTAHLPAEQRQRAAPGRSRVRRLGVDRVDRRVRETRRDGGGAPERDASERIRPRLTRGWDAAIATTDQPPPTTPTARRPTPNVA